MVVVTVPLIPSKVTAWKVWIRECLGPRRAEFEAFNRRMDLVAHRAWLSNGPQGPMAVVFHEGPGAKVLLQRLATSEHPFDTWFRERISEYHGIDFAQPVETPPPELVLDWHARKPEDALV
jgi:hypothetical protein